MRTYSYMFLAIIIAFLLSLGNVKIFTLNEMSLFLTVVGLIYGLIAAFTINNAWERFSKIRDSISTELGSLTNMYLLSKSLSDKASFHKLKQRLIEYCTEVPKVEWHEYWTREKTHRKFRDLEKITVSAKLRNEKDHVIFDKMVDALASASNARNQQLVLAQSRISKVQWVLNLFLSAVIIVGLLLLNIEQYALSTYVTTVMIAAVIMILIVIYELDTMKVAEEEVSVEPYRQIVRIIKLE